MKRFTSSLIAMLSASSVMATDIDHSQLINRPGGGSGVILSADLSQLETTPVVENGLGRNFLSSSLSTVADDFTVGPGGMRVTGITVFGYQTSATSPTFATLHWAIGYSPTVTLTSALVTPTWWNPDSPLGAYRVLSTTTESTVRRIQVAEITGLDITLGPGTYYLSFAATGATFTPYIPTSLAVHGQNGLSSTSSGPFVPLFVDALATTGADLPFIIHGDDPVNQPPTIDPIGEVSVYEEQPLVIQVTANDPDLGQVLTYSLNGAPYGMNINPSTGVLTFKPAAIQTPATYTFDIVVTDNGTPPASATISVNLDALRETRTAAEVRSWGYAGNGELAMGNFVSQDVLQNVVSLQGMSRLIGGWHRGFARSPSGSWVGWGLSAFGEVGAGSTGTTATPAALPALSNYIDLGAGFFQTLGITAAGTLDSWGANSQGELGDPSAGAGRLVPGPVPGVSNVLRASDLFGYFSLVAINGQSPLTFGRNVEGQLADGTGVQRNSPVTSLYPNAVEVEAGDRFSLALLSDGTVACTGNNSFGQLGNGTFVGSSTPNILGLTDVVDIEAGNQNGYALCADGTVWAWGTGIGLGDGIGVPVNVPTQVVGLTDVVDIEAGEGHVLALKSDGTVWGWGRNTSAQTGVGYASASILTPQQVPGLANMDRIATTRFSSFAYRYGAVSNQAPVLDPIGNLSLDEETPLTLDANATDPDPGQILTYSLTGAPAGMTIDSSTGVVSWTPTETQGPGTYPITVVVTDNGSPAQSDSEAITITVDEVNETPSLAPISNQTVDELVNLTFTALGSDSDLPSQTLTYSLVGAPVGAAINPASGVFSWTPSALQGPAVYNFTVRVTDNGTPSLSADQPVQVTVNEPNSAPTLAAIGDQSVYEEMLLTFQASGNDADAGQLLTFSLSGDVPYGAYINPDTGVFTYRPTPIQTPNSYTFDVVVTDNGTPPMADQETITVTTNRETRTANGVWAWGHDLHGMFGLGTTSNSRPLTALPHFFGTSRFFGNYGPIFGRDPQALWKGWGYNGNGQLGTGSTSPTAVLSPISLPHLTGQLEVAGGGSHVLSLDASGQAFSWGLNASGQLGDGTTLNHYAPAPMLGGSSVFTISRQYGQASFAVRTSGAPGSVQGRLYSTGRNLYGQLGQGGSASLQLAPVLLNLDVIRVRATEESSVMLTLDGRVFTAGQYQGFVNYSTPVDTGLTDVVQIECGAHARYALKRDGTVWAWGQNTNGECGTGSWSGYQNFPAQVINLTNVIEIAGGDNSCYALKSDGTVWAWGGNWVNQVGNGGGVNVHTPVQIPGLAGIDRIATFGPGGYAWKYGPYNAPPQLDPIGNQTIDELTTLNLDANATDANAGQVLTFSLVNAPAGMTINSSTGAIAWTPTEAQGPGVYTFDVRVSDDGAPALSDSETISVTVNEVNLSPNLINPGPQVGNEATPFTLQLGGSDDDVPVQSLSYALVSGPSGLTVSPSGLVLWTPGESDGGSSPGVTVSLTDGVATVQETFTISVTEDNQAPELADPVDQTVDEGTLASVMLSATDADLPAQSLTYSLVSGPGSVTGNTWSWTPGETDGSGSFTVTVQVSDGTATASQSFDVTVNEVNRPPVLVNPGAQTANENSAFTLQLSGSDADLPAQPLTYALSSCPSGLTVSPSGLVLWTPGESDGGTSPSVTLSLSDGIATVQQTFTISVTEDNQPPIVNGVVDRYGVMGTLFWLVLDVTDPDGPSTFTYSLGAGAPAGMTLDANGLLKWVPTGAQVGMHTFDILVTDNGMPSATATRSVMMTVARPGRLRPWGLSSFGLGSPPAGAFRSVEGGYSFHSAVRSTGELVAWGDNYTGGVSPLPAGTFFSSSNGLTASVALTTGQTLVNWGSNAGSPPSGAYLAAAGTHSFPVAVREDGTAATWAYSGYNVAQMPSGKFSLIATGYLHAVGIRPDATLEDFGNNDYGQLDNTPTGTFKEVAAGERHSVAIRTDGTLASWGSDYDYTGTYRGQVSGTPTGTFLKVAAGRYFSVGLRTDGTLVAWGENSNGQVSGVPSGTYVDIACTGSSAVAIRRNQSPSLTNPGPQTAPEQTPFSLQLTGSDPDVPADPLTYALVSGPSGLTVSASGLVQWTPGETDGGTAPDVTVSLTDGAETVQTTFSITVNETNQNPVLTDPADLAVNEGSLASVSLSATDPDLPAQSLTYSLVSGPGSVTGNTWTWTPGESDGPGNQAVVVQVSDGTATASQSFTVTVNEENQPPVLVNPGPQTAGENSPFTLQMSGSDPDLPAQGLTFAKVSGPTGLTVSPTGLVLWTPGESDGGSSPSVTVSLSDGVATVQETFVISVVEDNQPLIVNGVVDRYGVMKTLFWLVLDVTDPDGPSTFTYSLGAGAPAGMTLDANGLLKWVPTGAQVGTHTFNIIVTDNGVPAATTTRSVTMTVASAGRLAAWGSTAAGIPAQVPGGVFVSAVATFYTATAIRNNGQLTSWGMDFGGITQTPGGTYVNLVSPPTGVLGALGNGTPMRLWGENINNMISSAPQGTFLDAAVSTQFGVTIAPDGLARSWSYYYSEVDPDGKFVDVAATARAATGIKSDGTLRSWGYDASYNLISGTPAGTFKAVVAGFLWMLALRTDGTLVAWGRNATGVVTGVPQGTFIAIAASYDSALALRSDGTLLAWGDDSTGLVSGVPAGVFSAISGGPSNFLAIRRNSPPTLTNPGPKNATEHSAFTLQLAGTDVETPTGLTYGLVSGPSGMFVSPTGLLSWTPGEMFGGTTQNVTVRVSDGIDTTPQSFTITVAEANGAPVANPDIGTVVRGQAVDIPVLNNDMDPEGHALQITNVGSIPNCTITVVNGQIRFAPKPLRQAGTVKFQYRVTDILGASSFGDVTVTITNFPPPPK